MKTTSANCQNENAQMNWVDLEKIAGFKFDIRYARIDNFLGEAVYSSPRAFLLEHVAADLVRVHEALRAHGFGLLIFDAYRPWSVTKLFWDRSSTEMRDYLANPDRGSAHNRGCAVDLSMYSLSSGQAVTMPSDFDEMNEKAHSLYPHGTEDSRRLREILQSAMKSNHFLGITNEWWHFNHATSAEHKIYNLSFSEMDGLLINNRN